MKYSVQDTINNHRIYTKFMQLGIDDGWEKRDKRENFELLLDITHLSHYPIENASILDVGCGTGDLVQFLKDKHIKKYVGIDIFEPALEKARKKFPDQKFINGDFLQYKFKRKFDFVFCSGALTTKLESDNYQILKSWIPKMWSLAKKGAVFNFLIENEISDNYLFLYQPQKVIKTCKETVPDAIITTIITDAGSDNSLQEMHIYLYQDFEVLGKKSVHKLSQ